MDCSVWNVSCTCVSARLYFVTEDDWLKSSFTVFLATSRQLFHFIHAIQLHRQYLSCVKLYAFAMFDKTVYNVIKSFSQRPFSTISDSLWGLLKELSSCLDGPPEAFRSSRKLFVRRRPVWTRLETILTPTMRANLLPKLSESLKKNHHESNQHVYSLRIRIFNRFCNSFESRIR